MDNFSGLQGMFKDMTDAICSMVAVLEVFPMLFLTVCYVMLCQVMFCHTMLCHFISRPTRVFQSEVDLDQRQSLKCCAKEWSTD